MNDSIFRISLDIHEHGSQAVLNVKKTDTGRKLYITLRAGGTPYIIEDDCYAVFKATKPDGSILYNACTIENNEIIYEFTEQTCTAVGRCRCEIALYGLDDKLITSPRFALLVDGTIYPDEFVVSTDEFSALAKQISDSLESTGAANKAAQNAVESANRANEAAEDANQAAEEAQKASDNANEAASKWGPRFAECVTHTEQALTEEQKAQARDNIGGAGAIEVDAYGGAISVADASNQLLRSLSLYGKTTQDGTPEPTDVLDESCIPLVTAGESGSVEVTITGKNLLNIPEDFSVSRYWEQKNLFIPAGTYKLSWSGSVPGGNDVPYFRFFDNMWGFSLFTDGREQTVTLKQDETYIGIYSNGYNSAGSAGVTSSVSQLMLSVEGGAFEPYKVPQTMTINTPDGLCGKPVDNGGNYTDENGQQWVCDEIDLARGVYIKRIHTVDFSKGEWVEEFSDSLGEDGDFWGSIFRLSDNAQMVAAKEGMPVLCSHINWASGLSESAYTSDGINVHADYMIISLGDFPQEILEELAENSVKVQYVMATPEEIPLSAEELEAYAALHTNKPNTTIVNNGGANMALLYVADTKTYIDNKFNELATALVANG